MRQAHLFVLAASVLAACGGGSSGPDTGGLIAHFDRSSIEATTCGGVTSVGVAVTLNKFPDEYDHVLISDSGAAFDPNSYGIQQMNLDFAFGATTVTLGAGDHRGTLSFAICRNHDCSRKYVPAGASIDYVIHVGAPPPSLTVSVDGDASRSLAAYDVVGVTSGQAVTVTANRTVTTWTVVNIDGGGTASNTSSTGTTWTGTISGTEGQAVYLTAQGSSAACGAARVVFQLPLPAAMGRIPKSTRIDRFSAGGQKTGWEMATWFVSGNQKTSRWYAADADIDHPTGSWMARGYEFGSNQSAPGPDGQWMTADDTVWGWEKYDVTITPSGADSIHRNNLYVSAGNDGTWFTDDDVSTGYLRRVIDASGAETRREGFDNSGARVSDWYGWAWDNHYPAGHSLWNSWDRQIRYDAAGTAIACLTHEFGDTDSQFFTREDTYAPVNGVCFDGDDQLTAYATVVNTY